MEKMNVDLNSRLIKIIMEYVQHYDSDKYWCRRSIGIDPANQKLNVIKLLYLMRK